MSELTADIFTPAHKKDYLLDAYNSIKNQPYNSWLIFPNNGLEVEDVPSEIIQDPRTVIVYSNDTPTSNIGALKRICCSVSNADLLIEIDHDDSVTPGIIDKIREAFEDPEVVFTYTDSAQYNDDDNHSPRFYGNANAENNYDSIYGWSYYDYTQDEFLYKAAVTPDPIPAHVSIIHNAPDHVRAFRRSTYEEVGGYDPSLSICDDQDLMCRLYLKGKFKHIKECGYLYRVYGSNSWLQRNADIQTTTVEMQKKYLRPMVDFWAFQNGYKKIDICGRFNKPAGYTSVDLKDADINADLNQRWPFEDSSIGVIRAFDALEHLDNIVFTMSEIHRVLIPGGYLLSETPSTSGMGAFQDPTHRCYAEDTDVLTYEGWKSIKEVNNGDLVLTMDPQDGRANYQVVSQSYSYDYVGQMIHFKTDCTDILVTPNHRMVYKSSGKGTSAWQFKEASNFLGISNKSRVFNNKVILKEEPLLPEFIEIPDRNISTGWYKNLRYKYPSESFMKFMGWYISEGSVYINSGNYSNRSNTYRITIHQDKKANPDKSQEIFNVILEMGEKPYFCNNGVAFYNKALALWLSELGHSGDKFIPQLLKRQPICLLDFMLEALLKGDGSRNGTTSFTYGTISKRLADDVSEVAQLCGNRATISVEKRGYYRLIANGNKESLCQDIYLVYISSKSIQYAGATSILYNGKVYCLGVNDYHTLYVRRNGRASWCGNSFLNRNSFYYYTRADQAQYIDNTSIRFKSIVLEEYYPNEWAINNDIKYIRADLISLKDGFRPHGLIEI